jgi:hypothetical protein
VVIVSVTVSTLLQSVAAVDAPSPPAFSAYSAGVVTIEWDEVVDTQTYEISYFDDTGTAYPPIEETAPSLTTDIDCSAQGDGHGFHVQLRIIDIDGVQSPYSIPVTIFCANVPTAPIAPTVTLASKVGI